MAGELLPLILLPGLVFVGALALLALVGWLIKGVREARRRG
jgi:hypothetical protein